MEWITTYSVAERLLTSLSAAAAVALNLVADATANTAKEIAGARLRLVKYNIHTSPPQRGGGVFSCSTL